jgi:ubiquinone/menaquinone biosynthesis C-methylase UbiE
MTPERQQQAIDLQTGDSAMTEEERILIAYQKRTQGSADDRYSWFNPATAFHLHEQEQAVLNLLKRHGLTDLKNRAILEVGCGGGAELGNFLKYGATPSKIHGVDLIPERVADCRRRHPDFNIREAGADRLPFDDASFDLVCQFVMFTSILDPFMRRDVAAEMLRVLKPDGLIIWYDYFISRPGNGDVRGVSKREILSLFSGCHIKFKRVSLAPPLARAVVPRSRLAAYLLGRIPLLRTHYLVAIRKPV